MLTDARSCLTRHFIGNTAEWKTRASGPFLSVSKNALDNHNHRDVCQDRGGHRAPCPTHTWPALWGAGEGCGRLPGEDGESPQKGRWIRAKGRMKHKQQTVHACVLRTKGLGQYGCRLWPKDLEQSWAPHQRHLPYPAVLCKRKLPHLFNTVWEIKRVKL